MRTLAFILEELVLPSAGQQLLDRFLLGYSRHGEAHRLTDWKLALHIAGAAPAAGILEARQKYGLPQATSLNDTLLSADAAIVVWNGAGAVPNDALLVEVLSRLKRGASCFVHGLLASSADAATRALALAVSRGVRLLAGTPLAVTWRLPEIKLDRSAAWVEGLVVVQRPSPVGELQALEGLLPFLESRRGGESGVAQIRYLEGAALWQASRDGGWSGDLLGAALSRSDTPQGDPVKDGRTQDLYGRGLVPRLARNPRGWVMEHRDGFRSVILALEGVSADVTVAIRARDGRTVSTQLLLTPAPAEEHFSLLAAVIEDFITGANPWSSERNRLQCALMAHFSDPAFRTGSGLFHRFSHCTPPAGLSTICT